MSVFAAHSLCSTSFPINIIISPIWRDAKKDRIEKQFYLPATAINVCYGHGRQKEVVRKKYQTLSLMSVVIFDQSQFIRIRFLCVKAMQRNCSRQVKFLIL